MVGCVRAKESVRPHILDDVVMHVLVEGGAFEIIGGGFKKKYIVMCESLQYWFKFVVIYKNQMPHANVMKNVLWEGIKLCAIFGGTRFFRQANGIF